MNPIRLAAVERLKPPESGPPWRWIEKNVGIQNSPYGDTINFGRTPWLKKPSEKFADNRIRNITLQCCVQGSKTLFMLSHGIYAMHESPAPLGYYVQTNEFVTKTAEARWLPMVKLSPLIDKLQPGNRFSLGKAEIYFDVGFSYIMAANKSNTQTISLRYVFLDDTFLWTPGMVQAAKERATRWWNKKIVEGSAGGELGSETAQSWNGSCQDEWRLMCPGCRRLQIPDIEKHLRWPTNEITKPKGIWNFEAVKRATRFRCEHCGTELPNTPETVRLMNDGADYLTMNPNAPSDNYGARWNVMCLDPSEFSWGDLAVEFIKAAQAWKAGYAQPMKDLKTKRLGLTYDPRSVNPFAQLPVIEIVSEPADAKSPYPKKWWPLQDYILSAYDVQADHFWGVVQGWSKAGDECTYWAGKLYNWSDLDEKDREYGIPPEDSGVDWSHRPQEVVREIARRGIWVPGSAGKEVFKCRTAYRGSDQFQFIWEKNKGIPGLKVERVPLPFAWPPQKGNPTMGLKSDSPLLKELKGRRVPIITWSNPSIKDMVLARRDRKVEAKVETLKGDWNAEYFRQMFGLYKEHVQPKYGHAQWKHKSLADDHIPDCVCMIKVRAIRRGLISDVMTVGEG